MRARRRRVPLVVAWAAGLVAAGLVAAPTGAAAEGPAAAPSDEQLRAGAAQVRAAGLPPSRPAATRSTGRATTITAGYADTCHDADGSRVDLREITFASQPREGDPEEQDFVLSVRSCTPWGGADLGRDGYVEIPLSVARSDGPDHLVVVGPAGGDELRLTVFDTGSGDQGTWTTAFQGAVTRPDDHTAQAVFPHEALDDPREFLFAATSVDGDKRKDLLPETYADPLRYPFSCSLQVRRAATVVVDPPAEGRLARFARAEGADVRTASSGVLSLDDVSDAALAALREAPGVRSAERAAVYRRAKVPDDPAYPQQWHLPAIGAPRAWDVRPGSGMVLAVIDDGVDGLRPDLAEKVVGGGLDTVWDEPQPLATDSDLGGHGTAVAGLAAAHTNNAFGVAGVDWNASVLPYRVFDAAGCASDGAVARALHDAADKGASVANLSLGGPADSEVLAEAVREVTARGVLVVAAAGNSRGVDDSPQYPAAYPEVLAVGATTRGGELATYSSGGDHVDITAPGGDGSGTPEGDLLVLGERGTLTTRAGTSFAAPLVSGAALLFRAGHPELSPGQVVEAIERSAVDAGPPGHDPDFGAGRLDLRALLGTPTPASRATAQACPPDQVPRGRFADVPSTSTHAANIDCVAWWQLSEGSESGYGPGESVTRAQMATFLARLIERSGGALPADPPDAYLDDEGSVHELSINQLANLGVVSGRGDGVYGPSAPVSRGQMATFLVRGYEQRSGRPLPPGVDYFVDDDGTTHEPRINQAAEAGFTGGLAGGGYGPDREVSRDAMATFLARVLDLLVEEDRTTPPGT